MDGLSETIIGQIKEVFSSSEKELKVDIKSHINSNNSLSIPQIMVKPSSVEDSEVYKLLTVKAGI